MTRLLRAAGTVVASLVLLAPAGIAVAADDPGPTGWPTIQKPDAGGSKADPGPAGWPSVKEPEASTSGDPQPVSWPSPKEN